MTSRLQVVTIDGLRGTGKSGLANSLRKKFGCDVLDIGPIFRLLAWLVDQNFAVSPASACEVLNLAINTEWICIRLDVGGRKTASRIEVKGGELEEELWNIKLDYLIRQMANSPEVFSYVKELAHRLVGHKPAIVIGREVGATIFPDARLKIVLHAGKEIRTERKISQLSENTPTLPSDYSLDRSEPMKCWDHNSTESVVIDTTFMSKRDVVEQASAYIMCRLGWVERKEEIEAHAI
jgi:cytidylate kinase